MMDWFWLGSVGIAAGSVRMGGGERERGREGGLQMMYV